MHKITLTNLSYSDALTYAKARNGGIRISREGWNGKGMYVIYFSPVANGLEMLKVLDNDQGGTTLPLRPFLLMKDASDCYVPWLASQTDMLETDWCIAEDEATLIVENETVEEESNDGSTDGWVNIFSGNLVEDLAKLLNLQVKEEIDNETKQLVEEIAEELELTPKEKKIKDFVESIKNNKIFITGMPLRLSNDESPLSRLNVNNLLKLLDQGIIETLQKVAEEKKAAEAKKEENKLYNNQTLFNTFYCTDPKLYVPTASEADSGLIDSITRLAAVANSNGYEYVQFNDGSCLKLEEKDSELIIRVAKRK